MLLSGDLAIGVLYAIVAPVWGLLSAYTRKHAGAWGFTPGWHRRLVPLFRGLFLLTLPVEAWIADRAFILPVFVVGAATTLSWLAWHTHYLLNAPRPLPRADSVRYNLAYMVNLIAFGLACHSFVCVVVAANVSAALLLVRERGERHLVDTAPRLLTATSQGGRSDR